MSYLSFIIKKRFVDRRRVAAGRELCYKNKNVCKTDDMLFLLVFLIFTITDCYGWLGGGYKTSSSNLGENTGLGRHPRYAKFDPPRIMPTKDFQTVKADSTYTFRCEGSRGVSWRIPETVSDVRSDLRSRISISYDEKSTNRNFPRPLGQSNQNNYRNGRNNSFKKKIQQPESTTYYVAQLTIEKLKYTDTGTFTCTYNGTTDLTSIDNSTSVHLYVDDSHHLLKETGVDFFHVVQRSTIVLPCMPTHPEVNVTLWREGSNGREEPVRVNKYISYDPKVGYRISPVSKNQHSGTFVCKGSYLSQEETYTLQISVNRKTSYVPPPHINRTLARHVRKGDAFSLTCSVTIEFDVMVKLSWKTPNLKAITEARVITPPSVVKNLTMAGTHLKVVEQALTIHRTTKEDQGIYSCTVLDHSGNTQTKSEFVRILEKEESYLRIYFDGYQTLDKTIGDTDNVQWVVQIEAHPQPTVEWYGPNGQIIRESSNPHTDYTVRTIQGQNARTILTVNRLSLSTAGTFTVKVYNDAHERTEAFTLIVRSKPIVQASVLGKTGVNNNRAIDNINGNVGLYKKGNEYTLKCSAKGYPLPKIAWMFKSCTSYASCDRNYKHHVFTHETERSSHWRDSVMKTVAFRSGKFICQACNPISCTSESIPFFVTDIKGDGNFAVDGPKQVLEGDPTKLKCSASTYNYTEKSIQWYKHTLNGLTMLRSNKNSSYEINPYKTEFSFGKELYFRNVTLRDKGRYVCKVKPRYEENRFPQRNNNRRSYDLGIARNQLTRKNVNMKEIAFDLSVDPIEAPFLVETNLGAFNETFAWQDNQKIIVSDPDKLLELRCRVGGKPRPEMIWRLNGSPVHASSNVDRIQIVEKGQVLRITFVTNKDEGLYECRAKNRGGMIRAVRVLQLKSSADKDDMYANFSVPVIIAVACAIALVFILIIVARLCYCRNKRCKRKSAWKEPPTPPTPRLTQYERPQDRECSDDDDCRMTHTSTTRDGSISPYTGDGNTCSNGIYGDGSIVGVGSNSPTVCSAMLNSPQSQQQQYLCPCHTHPIHPCQTLIPKCSICDFSVQTLPMHQMGHTTMTLRRGHGNIYSNAPYDTLLKGQSLSPRLSAEF